MDRTTLRRAALFVGAIGYIALGLVHPVPDPELGDATSFFVFLHLVQPVLIGLLAYGLWALVDGIPGRAAKIARFAVVPYAIAYTIFDTISGISMGLLVGEANSLSVADQAVAATLIDNLRDHWLGYPIYVTAGLSWLIAVVSVAVALGQRAPRHVSLLIGIGGAIFALAHPFPPGPIGMTLFLAGVVLYELRVRRATDRVEVAPAFQT